MKQGRAFEHELAAAAKALGICYTKIPTAGGFGTGCQQESPYDAFIVDHGTHLAIEAKSLSTWGAFPLARLPEHQRAALSRVIREGGRAFLLINMRRSREGKPNNYAVAFDMRFWQVLLGTLGGRKSIPLTVLTDDPLFTPIRRLHVLHAETGEDTLVWDLNVLRVPK